jgi:uncharacterized protein YoaH (UPF0181 family)
MLGIFFYNYLIKGECAVTESPMFDDLPTLSHEEQQAAVEKIQKLMEQGVSSGQAIQMIADEIRQQQADKK